MTSTELHNLAALPKEHPRKRVGRGTGSGRGTYSGKGTKGQRARSGGRRGLKRRSIMREFLKKTPKLGGFRSQYKKPVTITLQTMESTFQSGETVSKQTLFDKGLLSTTKKAVKIVATGALTKKLIIHEIPLSQPAKKMIILAGGAIQE